MDSDKLNDGEDPPLSTSIVQENDILTIANSQNGAADNPAIFYNGSSTRVDPLSFLRTSFPAPPVSQMPIHRSYQPYTHNILQTDGNMMVDHNKLHNLKNPLIDPNSININTSIPNLYRRDLPFPEGKANWVSYNHDKVGAGDIPMNYPPHFNSFQNSEINRNFMGIRANAGGGYEMTRQGGEAGSHIHGPQLKDFAGLGGTKFYYPQNRGETIISNRGLAAQFGYPNNIDGSSLSLGIGGKMDTVSKSGLSSRDLAVSAQLNSSHVRQATGSLSPGQNMFSGFSRFQHNVAGFTSSIHNAGGWSSANNNIGLVHGTDTGLKSSPSHILQKPQGSFGSSSARLLDSGQNETSGLASESVNFNRTTTRQISDELQKRFVETMQLLPESSMVSSFTGFPGNSQEKLGQLIPASEDSTAQAVDQSAQIPRRKRVQTAGQLLSADDGADPCAFGGGQFPKRVGVQVSKDRAAQAAGSGLLPQRFGVDVNEHSATQAAGYGLSKGQVMSTAKGYGTSHDYNALGGPSLQRGVIRGPPAAPQGQHKKRALKIPILPSVPSPQRNAAAGVISTPAHVPRIKYQDPDGIPQPTGEKCMLCKRDLSFTAEGPVFLPAMPPAVAILPCGHTFHDQCLDRITPQDQSKNPPCIPCAIGET